MDRLDRVAAFSSAIGSVWGGIPALFLAVYLGIMFGGGDGDLRFVIFEFLFTQLRSKTVLFTLPTYATCLLLLLYSEISRLRILYIAFAISSIATAVVYANRFEPKTWRLSLLVLPPAASYLISRFYSRFQDRG